MSIPDPIDHQPRERAVPCQDCGMSLDRSGRRVPRTMTSNDSARCDRHETQRVARAAAALNEARALAVALGAVSMVKS